MGSFGDSVLILLLVSFSALLSSTEAALFSLSPFQLKWIRERFHASSVLIQKLLQDTSGLLLTILISNELVNATLATLIARSVGSQMTPTSPSLIAEEWISEILVGSSITSILVIFVCEITPKILGTKFNTIFSPILVTPISLFHQILKPIRKIAFIVFPFIRPKSAAEVSQIREEDFLSIVEEATKEGKVEVTELELIRNLFNLDDTPIHSLMTPLASTTLLPADLLLKDALSKLPKYSRIPVFEEDPKLIQGILYTKDLLLAREDPSNLNLAIREFTKRPIYIHENTRIQNVFRRMRNSRTHLAIITGNNKEAVGIVTMNVILDLFLREIGENST